MDNPLTGDIAERKRAEAALRESQALYHSLVEQMPAGVFRKDAEGRYVFVNSWFCRLKGVKAELFLGKKPEEVATLELVSKGANSSQISRLAAQGTDHHQQIMLTGRRIEVEEHGLGPDGKEQYLHVVKSPIVGPAGKITGSQGIMFDITDRKQLEANFLRAQRLEGVGALAGGIAHDLNNILQPILMAATLLDETAGDPETHAMLVTVKACAQRGADIIKQLLTFARGKPDARVPLPVRHLVGELDKILRETFPRNIQLIMDAPQNLWPVLGDPTQVHQALMNLCVNARDAMPNGGKLAVEAKNLTADETLAAATPEARPGPFVCLSVTDTGAGIPPELLDRIFDPFFTTKEIGQGTGLGLATVLGIVRGHGGFIRVNSQVGRGTTFELYLPASPEAKAAQAPEHAQLPPPAHGELILVVDDEASVRKLIQRTLEQHGYRIGTAAEGQEAIAFFARHRAEIKAVITDLMMPGMDGPALIHSLRQLEPHLPILSMTGLGEQAEVKGIRSLNLPVLLKPFARGELLGALSHAMAVEPQPDGMAN
ncbi:MAG TPA: ATP-binding protein [Verrucomicrobiae bacterium]|nr:ATP-binding protein [Verrucomicrobiae bacterium]